MSSEQEQGEKRPNMENARAWVMGVVGLPL